MEIWGLLYLVGVVFFAILLTRSLDDHHREAEKAGLPVWGANLTLVICVFLWPLWLLITAIVLRGRKK